MLTMNWVLAPHTNCNFFDTGKPIGVDSSAKLGVLCMNVAPPDNGGGPGLASTATNSSRRGFPHSIK